MTRSEKREGNCACSYLVAFVIDRIRKLFKKKKKTTKGRKNYLTLQRISSKGKKGFITPNNEGTTRQLLKGRGGFQLKTLRF